MKKNAISKEEAIRRVTAEYATLCREKGTTTSGEVKKFIFDDLWERYKGSASRDRIDLIADDFAESVCLKLGIPQE